MDGGKRVWNDLSSEEKSAVTKTEPNEARFWTGSSTDDYGDGIGGEYNAKYRAIDDDGKTLEMKLFDDNNIDRDSIDWREASECYAKGASGDVKCYKGDNVREDSVYNTAEKPVINDNENINSITEVDNVVNTVRIRKTGTSRIPGQAQACHGYSTFPTQQPDAVTRKEI